MRLTILVLTLVWLSGSSLAQIDIGSRVKNKINQRAEQKIDQAIDKTLDETEKEVSGKGDKKAKESSGGADSEADKSGKGGTEKSAAGGSPSLKTYGKFDFIPGEKIIVEDNFSHVALGDFPAEYNSNSTAEVVTVDGREGKWLMIAKEGVFIPDYASDLPENFTLQFDLICNEGFSFYSSGFTTTFVPNANRLKLGDYGKYSHPANAVRLDFHPQNAGGGQGHATIETWDASGADLVRNEVTTAQFSEPEKIFARVSIWRQKQRLRVYLNEEKVYDIPRAFDAASKYNALIFGCGGMHQDQDRFLISNIRMAVGAPDTRSKLITEGKLVTRGILFDSGSDRIKPESYGTLKDIAAVLTENPDVRVTIIGHTDSDGDDAMNLALSKKRAEAVKNALTSEFAIAASRMETDGKGEGVPADKNDTPAGKANNRRVEFVKL